MKKVLFISPQPFFQWRGSPIRVGFSVRALAELGMQVDFLTLPFGEPRDVPGVRIIRVPNIFLARNVSIGPSLLKAAFDVILFFKGLGLALRNRYHVIHCIEDAGAIGVVIAGLTRSRLVFEKHSDPSSYRKGPVRNLVMWLYARVERFTIRHSDAVIGTGPGLAEQAAKVGAGRPVHDIFDIPSSLAEADSEATAAIRARLKQDERDILITYVGSFAVYQGVDLMFDAVPLVAEEQERARFVIIGGTSREIEERKARLAARNARERVVFAGKVAPDDLPDYLAASDIFLSPRLTGVNTPLKLLDYLKAGRAIVATDTPANRLILNENNAVLVKPEPVEFAEGICRLVKDSELRLKLGADGKRLIAEKYNYGEFKKKLAACYEGLNGGTDS